MNSYVKYYDTYFSFVNTSEIPASIHLQTVEILPFGTKNEVLLRLAHLYAVNEDSILSQPVKLNLSNLFYGQVITNIMETTLTTNQNLENYTPLIWNDDASGFSSTLVKTSDGVFLATLSAMEIRTYVIQF